MAAPRMLEVVLPVDPARVAGLTEPDRLGAWLCSSTRTEAGRLLLVVEEEYGYRRVLACDIARHDPAVSLELRIASAWREWDGSDGVPVGPAADPALVEQPEFVATTIAVLVRDGVARARWDDIAGDALDASRRAGVLLRHAIDRARETFGEAPLMRHAVARALECTPRDAWSAVEATFGADPGRPWVMRGSAGPVGGRVVLAVGGRRLAGSWRAPGQDLASGLLDVRIGHERGAPGTIEATLELPAVLDDGLAAAWLEQVADELVAAMARGREDT